jgi:hypothetical protein
MIFSEKRDALFGIMLSAAANARCLVTAPESGKTASRR